MDASNCDVASTAWSHWHGIPWQVVHQEVGRLQARIAKAAKAGKWRTVRSLQRLLVRSESAKALSVRRVTENRGRNTPGIDRQTWSTPEVKWDALNTLGKGYHPQPLRRVYIPKSNGERRPLGIPTMTDRAMQALHLLALDPVAEVVADTHSYGFRRERSTTDAIEQVRNALGRSESPTWVLEGDIKGCFDNISHDWLEAHGLRATMSTALNEIGYPKAWVDAQLSHADPNRVRATYNHAQYVEQRRAMMQDWANRLDLFELGEVEVASRQLIVHLQGLPGMTWQCERLAYGLKPILHISQEQAFNNKRAIACRD